MGEAGIIPERHDASLRERFRQQIFGPKDVFWRINRPVRGPGPSALLVPTKSVNEDNAGALNGVSLLYENLRKTYSTVASPGSTSTSCNSGSLDIFVDWRNIIQPLW